MGREWDHHRSAGIAGVPAWSVSAKKARALAPCPRLVPAIDAGDCDPLTLLLVEVVAVEARADRLEMAGPLEAILTADTGDHLGQGPKARRGDGLPTLYAEAILALPQALERLGQLVHARDEQAPGGEAHLAVFVQTDHIHLIGQGGIVPYRA